MTEQLSKCIICNSYGENYGGSIILNERVEIRVHLSSVISDKKFVRDFVIRESLRTANRRK